MSRNIADNTLERQNEAEMNQLHGKIKALRSVTIDILDDSQRQNDQLDRTANTFSQFTNSLSSVARTQVRTFANQSPSKQLRTIGYIVGGLVVVWLLGGWWFRRGGSAEGDGQGGLGAGGVEMR